MTDPVIRDRATARVTIAFEFDLQTEERIENFGSEVLWMTDEEAGQWLKGRVREAVPLAERT